MTEKKQGLQPVSAKHLRLIKWIPNGDLECHEKKLKIFEALAPNWRDVATLVGLTQPQIVSIENPGSGRTHTMCLDEVLKKWRRLGNEDYPYTWDGVKMLLQDVELQELARSLDNALSSDSSTVRGNFKHESSYEKATKKENILKPYYSFIYELLDFDKLYPHLCRKGLLTAKEKSEITKYELTRGEKISKLLDMVILHGLDTQREFIDLIGQIAEEDAKQKELYKICLSKSIPYKEKDTSTFWTIAVVMAVVSSLAFIFLVLFLKYPGHFNLFDQYHSKSLVCPSKIFVGREQEMSKLMNLLSFNSSNTDIRIVNIVGSPGFGKSTLAIHVGNEMVKQGIVVHYINMVDNQGLDSSVQEILSEKILKAAEYTLERYDFHLLKGKLRNIFWNTLIIIDNCDELVHNNNMTKFFKTLETMVELTTRLKILITSREVTTHLEYFKRYPLYELSKQASCELIKQKLPADINANTTEIEQVANLTGNAPLALQIIGALLSSPNPPLISQILNELDTQPISFLSSDALEYSDKINVSISLSYRYLSADIQKISQYLANFPGSFTLEVASEILNCTKVYPCGLEKSSLDKKSPSVTKTLGSLLFRSLIELDNTQQRYMFHRLIKEFFKEKLLPQDKDEFNSNFQEYYSSLLGKIMDTFDHDYKLALQVFDSEKHNYQKLLYDLKTKNHNINSFIKMIQSIIQSLEQHKFKVFSFSDNEIITSLQSALEYIEEKQLIQQNKHNISLVVTYIKVLCKVIKIKKDLSDFKEASLIYKKSENTIKFVTEFTNELESNEYKIEIYKHLTKLYEILENRTKAAEYRSKIHNLKGNLDYFKEFDTLHYFLLMERKYFFLQEYEKCAHYYDLAYKEISLLPAIEQFMVFWKMATVYFDENEQERLDKCYEEMHKLLKNNLLTRTNLYEKKEILVSVVDKLIKIKLLTIADDLKDALIEAILEMECRENFIKCTERNDLQTLKIIESYFNQQNYNKTIQFGKQFLNNYDICGKNNATSERIRGEILVAAATFWGEKFEKGMDLMEKLYPIVSNHTHLQIEFSVICKYLIPRMRYISTCYPEVYSIPRYIAMATVIAVFALPPQYDPFNQEQSSPPPISTVPEIAMLSSSKIIATRDKFELGIQILNVVDYKSTPFSWIKFILKFFIDNIKSLWRLLYHFYSRYIIIRFVINVFLIHIRLDIFLFITFRIIFEHIIFGFFFVGVNIIRLCMVVLFKFPNILLFPLTLVVINFMTRVLEFLFSCYLAVVRITPFIPRPWVYRKDVFNTLYYISLF